MGFSQTNLGSRQPATYWEQFRKTGPIKTWDRLPRKHTGNYLVEWEYRFDIQYFQGVKILTNIEADTCNMDSSRISQTCRRFFSRLIPWEFYKISQADLVENPSYPFYLSSTSAVNLPSPPLNAFPSAIWFPGKLKDSHHECTLPLTHKATTPILYLYKRDFLSL